LKFLQPVTNPGVKQSVHEADHSPPSAEVKNVWHCTSTPNMSSGNGT